MKYSRLLSLTLFALLASCATSSNKDSIGQLKNVKIDLADIKIEGGFEKAMQSYQKFLEQTPESAMTPEALRRLADLKVQKEYGTLEGATKTEKKASLEEAKKIDRPASLELPKTPQITEADAAADIKPPLLAQSGKKKKGKADSKLKESGQDFEKRATQTAPIKTAIPVAPLATPDGSGADLQTAGTLEAIALYKKLLAKYPNYDRNDQVLYQLSRAYEEIGQVEEAMKVMNRIVKGYPKSRYFDEVQFRRGEYFFTPS